MPDVRQLKGRIPDLKLAHPDLPSAPGGQHSPDKKDNGQLVQAFPERAPVDKSQREIGQVPGRDGNVGVVDPAAEKEKRAVKNGFIERPKEHEAFV